MKLSLGAKTDCGRRPNNEDFHSVATGDDIGINVDAVLVVADGMGGRNFGERASETAVDVVKSMLVEKLSVVEPDHEQIKAAIESAIDHANATVYELSLRDNESQGMGTTCVVAIVADGRLHMGHAGDSRLYVIHNGRIELLTDDHSFVAEQVRLGIITAESARTSKFRNVITRAVGIDSTIIPDVAEYPIDEVEAILLCTDGLTNMVRDPDIERVLLTSPTPQAAADKLVRMAKAAGGSDNITAVVARLGEGPIVEQSTTEDPPDELPEDDVVVMTREEIPGQTPSRAPLAAVSLTAAILLCIAVYLGSQLTQAGYRFQASPPFFVKPAPPAPPPPLDLTTLSYGAPRQVFPYPVEPEPLTLSAGSNILTVVSSTSGKVLRLSMDGSTLNTFPPPGRGHSMGVTTDTPRTVDPPNLHYATDPGGDLYVSDAATKSIYKLRPSGELLLTLSGLQKPESIAVDNAGDIYVVDASTLKVIPATPGQ